MAQHQHQHQHQLHLQALQALPFASLIHLLNTTSFLLPAGTNPLFALPYAAHATKAYLAKRSAKPKAVFPDSRRPTRKLRAPSRTDARSRLKATLRKVVRSMDGATSVRLDKSLRTIMHAIDGPANKNMQPNGVSQEPEAVLKISALPQELLKKVFKHTTTADLISLSLVSKSFRDVAAEQLYQNFHIVFPDEDDPSNDSTIDGLAGGLDTFVTSDYNYAQYLREIALYTLSGGEKAERAYRPYLYALSCGKFLNTLLLMTLRKAKSLEKFRWDIRVELSRPVFQALHQISSLTELHLRMQYGSTQYEPPPPIPSLVNTASEDLSHGIPGGHSAKKGSKLGKSQDGKLQQDPPTFSGFKRLKSLSVLEIDSHDYGLELKTCIHNSSHTLSKLQLSFSETLASRSRKPPPEITQDPESDEDVEDFNNSLPGPLDDGGHPAKVYRAKEERKKQENVLAEIFGLADNPSIAAPSKPERTKLVLPEGSAAASDEFVKELKAAAHKYLESVIASGALQDQESCAKILTEIKASIAKIYKNNSMVIEKEHAKKLKAQLSAFEQSLAAMNVDGEMGEDLVAGLPSLDDTSLSETQGQQTDVVMSGAADVEQPSLFDDSNKDKQDITTNNSDPDDIKVDEPETNELSIEEGEPIQTEAEDANLVAAKEEPTPAEHTPIANSPLLERVAQLLPMIQWEESPNLEALETGLQQLQTIRSSIINGHPHIDRDGFRLSVEDVDELLNLCREMHQVRKTEDDSNSIECQQREKKVLASYAKVMDDQKQRDYIRQTRGLMLEALSIYLIPIKASVLSKALDLQVLQDITLLNCGSQVPFWSMLARENKSNPLPLNKIHTDNVTKPFLQLVSQLGSVTELCLLEKAQKSRTESFAAKSTMRIDDIRRLALKKHASTLKVLKIKNEVEHSWDVNEKTMMLLCKRARNLEELAVCFGIKALHTLLQNNSGLSCLRALHIVQFRQDDTCLWVSREVRKFTIDCFSQNPAMQLEYLAFDNSLERLIRRNDSPKSKPSNVKNKTKSQVMDIGEDSPSVNITWDSGIGGSGSSSEESEDDLVSMIGGLKIDTIEGIRFHDVAGIKIFTNEVLLGRL